MLKPRMLLLALANTVEDTYTEALLRSSRLLHSLRSGLLFQT